MKLTSLHFILEHLFDKDIKQEVHDYVMEHGHRASMRSSWSANLERVPPVLSCQLGNAKTVWVLIRNKGDIELRTALPLDQNIPDDCFKKMPQGIQRAIAIYFPSDPNALRLGWRLFQNTVKEHTSNQFNGNIKTFSQERPVLRKKFRD